MSSAGRVRPIVAAVVVLAATVCAARAEEANDYPTSARAEYVYGCMKANGETRQAIEQCSCSIDVVASIVPYERYVTAETALSMSQVRRLYAAGAAVSFRPSSMNDVMPRARARSASSR